MATYSRIVLPDSLKFWLRFTRLHQVRRRPKRQAAEAVSERESNVSVSCSDLVTSRSS